MDQDKPRRLFEREKELMCIFGAICAIGACMFFVGNPEYYQGFNIILKLVIILMFLLTAAGFFAAKGIPSRGKKYAELKEKASEEDRRHTGYVTLSGMKDTGAAARKQAKKNKSIFAFLRFVFVAVIFISLIIISVGDIYAMIHELRLPEIEKTQSVLRLVTDIVMRAAEQASIILGLFLLPEIMAARNVNTVLLKVQIGITFVGAFHEIYYFAGRILIFPPNIADIFIVGVMGFLAALSYMGIRTENRKKDFKAMNVEVEEIY